MRWLARALAIAMIGAVLPVSASTATVSFMRVTIDGEPGSVISGGRRIQFQSADVGTRGPSTITFAVNVYGHVYDIWFAPPSTQQRLAVGYYANAERADFRSPGAPGFDLMVDGTGCNSLSADFVIDEISFAGDGTLTSLAARFAHHCNGTGPTEYGTISFNSSIQEPSLNFGSRSLSLTGQNVAVATPSQTIQITNMSPTPVTFGAATPSRNDLVIESDDCADQTLAPDYQCAITVHAFPLTWGSFTGSIGIPSSATTFFNAPAFRVPVDVTVVNPNPGRRFSENLLPGVAPGIPVIDDFNNDGRDDILKYQPGRYSDTLFFSTANHSVTTKRLTINGDYDPFNGDFNGDGNADIFWYGPGTKPDALWLGTGTGSFISKAVSVSGTYRPLVADFDGDLRDDILWYGVGTASDGYWIGQPDGTFASLPVRLGGNYPYVTGGDFNGDNRIDLIFWNPNATVHPVWLSRADHRFTASSITGPGEGSIPMPMNIDGDGLSDVIWYGPGRAADGTMLGSAGYTTSTPLSITNRYEPLWGNFNGDNARRSDIVWWSASPSVPDSIWLGSSTGLHRSSLRNSHAAWDSSSALLGNFDGEETTDIRFYGGQSPYELVFFGIDTDGPSSSRPQKSRTTGPLLSCDPSFHALATMCSARSAIGALK